MMYFNENQKKQLKKQLQRSDTNDKKHIKNLY